MDRIEKKSLLAMYELKRREETQRKVDGIIALNNLTDFEEELDTMIYKKRLGEKIQEWELRDSSDLPHYLSVIERWFLAEIRKRYGMKFIFSDLEVSPE